MADGLFDDLIPAQPKPRGTGLFDDLLPSAPTENIDTVRVTPNAGMIPQAQFNAALGSVFGNSAPIPAVPAAPQIAVPMDMRGPRVDRTTPGQRRQAERDLAGTVMRPSSEIERSFGDVLGDMGNAYERGTNALASAVVGLPTAALNVAQRIWSPLGTVPLSAQPEAVQELRDVWQADTQQVSQRDSDKLLAQQREFAQTEGTEALGYLASNPSFTGITAVEQTPQFATLAVPGGVGAKIAAGAVLAGGMSEDQAAQGLAEQVARGEITEHEAIRRATDAGLGSAVLNFLLPKLGGAGAQTLERVATGRIAQGTGVLGGAARGLAGEGTQGYLSEAGDELIGQAALGQGFDLAAANRAGMLGVALEGPLGGLAGAVEGLPRNGIPQAEQQDFARAGDSGRRNAPPPVPVAVEPTLGGTVAVSPAVQPMPQGAADVVTPIEDTSDLDAMVQAVLGDPAVAQALAMAEQEDPRFAYMGARAERGPPVMDVGRIDDAGHTDSRWRRPEQPLTPPAGFKDEAGPVEIQPTIAPRAVPARARRPATKTDKAGKPMDLLRVIAANGGLSRAAWQAQGVDPADFRTQYGINWLFRAKGGMTPSDLREFMQQEGYLAADRDDRPAEVEDNDAIDLFDRAFRGGEEIFAPDQQERVAAWREARRAEEDAFRAEREPDEFDAWLAAIPAEAEAGEAADLYDLLARAYDLGATDADVNDAMLGGTSTAQQLIDRLENDNGDSAGSEAGDSAPGESRERRDAPPDEGVGSAAGQQARRPADLFPEPTSREEVEAERRRRDEQRDGKTGPARTDMEAGDGELFAGPRPVQTDIESEPREQLDVAELADADLTDAERDAFARQAGGRETQMRAAVDAVLGPVASKVNYLRSWQDLPNRLRTGAERRLRQRGGVGQTAAMFDPVAGQVYLFTDANPTPEQAVFNVAHEIAGHQGLRALLGNDLDKALDIALQNPTVAAVAEAIALERNIDASKDAGQRLATEEALAELAAAVRTGNYDAIADRYGVTVPQGIRERVKAAVDNFLRRLKALFDRAFGKDTFTDEDVRALLENAWQAAQGQATSAGEDADAITPDQTETPEFKRWFGDSKVVDADGKPLVVYHGTYPNDKTGLGKAIDVFDRLAIVKFNKANHRIDTVGSWFSTRADEKGAGMYGNTIYPVFLSIKKPYVTTFKTMVRRAHMLAGTWEGYDERGERPAPGRPGVYENASANIGEKQVNALREWLQAMGRDGIKITNDPNGSPEFRDQDAWIALEPEQIKSATANRGTFDPESPSILESVADANQRAEYRRNEAATTLPVSRGTAGWNYDEGKWEGRKGQRSRIIARLQDKMLAWKDVQQQVEQQIGQALPDAQNVYRLENLMHGRAGQAIDRLESEAIKPLLEAMRDAKVTTEQLEEYLYARHAPERNAQIAKINPGMPDGGSGMTNAEAAAILAKADRAKLDPLARRVDAMLRQTRNRMLANGLITQEQYDAMQAQYLHYVPLRGKKTTDTDFDASNGGAGRGLDTRRQPIKQAMGRGAGNRAVSILGEVIGDAQRSIIMAEKARVGRALMRLVLANPNQELWQVEPVQTERKMDANGEVYEAVVNDWSDPSIIAVRHKGQLFKVQINSQPLAQALNHVGVDQLSGIFKALGALNRYFSAVLTKYNPAFVPVNATRDALFGLTGLAAEHGEAAALDAALSYPQAAAAAFRQAINRGGAGQWDTWAREFAEAGGKTGYVNMPSVEDLQRAIGSGGLRGYSPTGVAKAARGVADAIGAVNDAIENALRLSAFVTLRKRGKTAEQAAEYAKSLTVNFNRKGSDGSTWNALFLFFNASMQGAVRTGQLMRKPKTWSYLGVLSAAQVVATMAMLGMKADDEDDNLWDKIPDHVKRRNLIIPLGREHILTIPMPYGFNTLVYASGRITDAMFGTDDPTKRAGALTADIGKTAIESFSPVPFDDGAFGLLPTAVRIPANLQANRNDFGRPIRREDPYSKSAVPRASMGRPDTLEIFKLAAKGLNRLGGGDDYTPPAMSFLNVAPEDLEYLVNTLGGGTMKFVTDVATVGQKAWSGVDPLTAKDAPITNRFASKVDNQAAQAALYYQRREVVDRGLKRVRGVYKAEGAEAAETLMQSMPELNGAAFKRRKKDSENGSAGSVIESNGSPQIVAVDESTNRGERGRVPNPKALTVFAAYKKAEEAAEARSDEVQGAYARAPSSIIPSEKTRERDMSIRTSNNIRQAAQNEFNRAWVEQVVNDE